MTNRQSEARTGGWKAFFGPLGRIVLAAVLTSQNPINAKFAEFPFHTLR